MIKVGVKVRATRKGVNMFTLETVFYVDQFSECQRHFFTYQRTMIDMNVGGDTFYIRLLDRQVEEIGGDALPKLRAVIQQMLDENLDVEVTEIST